MNGIQVFQNEQFGQVRVVEQNGEPWFVAADVCAAFGDTNRNRTMSTLDDDEKGYTQIATPGGKQSMAIVNEPGVYSMLFAMRPTKSRKVSDEYVQNRQRNLAQFKHWITHDVIPSIRKHGGYLTPEMTERVLSDPDTIIRLATELKQERIRRIELETQNAEKQKLIEEYKPKVVKYDTILDSNALIAPTTIAKSCGFTSAIKLNQFLYEQGIQYKHGDVWELYSKYSGKGYMSSYHFTDMTGRVRVRNAWTPKGYIFLCDNVFKPNGIEPASVEATLSIQSEHPIAS